MKILIWALLYSMSVACGIFLTWMLFWLGAFDSINILFYRGIAISLFGYLLTTAIVLISCIGLRTFNAKHGILKRDVFTSLTLALCVNITFLIVFPVSIDRSISIFLLGRLADANSGFSKKELEEYLVADYVRKFDAVGRRMSEQITTGNVELLEGKYFITSQGAGVVRSSRWIGKLFGADLRLINNETNLSESVRSATKKDE